MLRYVKRKIVAPLREFMVFPRYILRGRPNGGVRPPLFPAKRLGQGQPCPREIAARAPTCLMFNHDTLARPPQPIHAQHAPPSLSGYAIGADGTVAQKRVYASPFIITT